ncbi:hypothetical protein B0H63DRAFT_515560 [Podospora didyma]|uniref:BTB domain-containing protein n=1 Tax=Podospora didyma TaxID=330526 RepID=A0AAE0K0K2_9PEZI|nr:hypothetical protein B0H63DRAFT_515560 [Podospora didyma]
MKDRFLSSDEQLLESGLFADKLHKNIICSRSVWFHKALNGHFSEAKTGHISIENFEPELVEWVIRYIYTGMCDIATLRTGTKTNFVTCIDVYTVVDFFTMDPLVEIALSTLAAELDAKLGVIQLQYDAVDWLDELFDAMRLVYQDTPVTDKSMTPIRAAFVNFAHAARFYLMQNDQFTRFLDDEAPVFALDMFRAMRATGDFATYIPEPHCSYYKNKPTRSDKGYYTHLAPEKPRLVAACSSCATKRDFSAPTTDWSGKSTKPSV